MRTSQLDTTSTRLESYTRSILSTALAVQPDVLNANYYVVTNATHSCHNPTHAGKVPTHHKY